MPPTTGRWGRIIAVTRLATGLILFFYVLTHNLNHALGLISLSAMEGGRTVFLGFWRPLELVLLLAALLHLSIGLRALYRRKSLRMPFLEATQLTLGLAAPPLLLLHIIGTAVAHALYGVEDRYANAFSSATVRSPRCQRTDRVNPPCACLVVFDIERETLRFDHARDSEEPVWVNVANPGHISDKFGHLIFWQGKHRALRRPEVRHRRLR